MDSPTKNKNNCFMKRTRTPQRYRTPHAKMLNKILFASLVLPRTEIFGYSPSTLSPSYVKSGIDANLVPAIEPSLPVSDYPGESGQVTTSKHVVVGEKYVLSSDDPKQSSGKSLIFEAFKKDRKGTLKMTEPVVVKLSQNTDAIEREASNYYIITRDGSTDQIPNPLFVKVHDYLEQADPRCPDLKHHSALVMEKGEMDLQTHIKDHGPMQGRLLQEAAYLVGKCIEAVHRKSMVWTEIKTANYVMTKKPMEFIKGIDLESAVPEGCPAVDFTAYAMPPEFAIEFLCGRQAQAPMSPSFDIWSLGMVLYEMATGSPYFHPDDDCIYVANTLRSFPGNLPDLNKNGNEALLDRDPALKDLIQWCLTMNPLARPNIVQALNHPYFYQSR